MGSHPDDAVTVESLIESFKKEHKKHDHNAVCRVCGDSRYIPHSSKGAKQTTRERACWTCEEVRTFDIERGL